MWQFSDVNDVGEWLTAKPQISPFGAEEKYETVEYESNTKDHFQYIDSNQTYVDRKSMVTNGNLTI